MGKVQFIETQAKSIINKVEGMPFMWTINPYRGCQHACAYCYARGSHEYLGYGYGEDFHQRILVKINAAQVLREELRRPSWRRDPVLIGANVDPYQPAERRYRLTRSILRILRDHYNPVSIITKSPTILQDLDVLQEMSRLGLVRVLISVGTLNREVWQKLEPQAPNPEKRIQALGELVKAGVPAGIMLAPIIPGLSDDPASLEAVIKMAVDYGAHFINPIVLHLRPGAKEWFMAEMERKYPDLVATFAQIYRASSYAPADYQERMQELAGRLKRKWGVAERYIPPVRTGGQLSLDMKLETVAVPAMDKECLPEQQPDKSLPVAS